MKAPGGRQGIDDRQPPAAFGAVLGARRPPLDRDPRAEPRTTMRTNPGEAANFTSTP
jgi:hypothetical protein